ncbi:hypothetical protein Efla_005457 [Eimeria flavescens]
MPLIAGEQAYRAAVVLYAATPVHEGSRGRGRVASKTSPFLLFLIPSVSPLLQQLIPLNGGEASCMHLASVAAADVGTGGPASPSQQASLSDAGKEELGSEVGVQEEAAEAPAAAESPMSEQALPSRRQSGRGGALAGLSQLEYDELHTEVEPSATWTDGPARNALRRPKVMANALVVAVAVLLCSMVGAVVFRRKPRAEPYKDQFRKQLQQLSQKGRDLSEAVATPKARQLAEATDGHLEAAWKVAEWGDDKATLWALRQLCTPQLTQAVQAMAQLQQAARTEGAAIATSLEAIAPFEGWPAVFRDLSEENDCLLALGQALKGFEESSKQVRQQTVVIAELLQGGEDITDVQEKVRVQATTMELLRLRALDDVNGVFGQSHAELEQIALNTLKAVTLVDRSEEQQTLGMEIDQLKAMCRSLSAVRVSTGLEGLLGELLPFLEHNLRKASNMHQQHVALHEQLIACQNIEQVAAMTLDAMHLEEQLNLILEDMWETFGTVKQQTELRSLSFPAAYEVLAAHIQRATVRVESGKESAQEMMQALEERLLKSFKDGSFVSPSLASSLLKDLKGLEEMIKSALVDFEASVDVLGRRLHIASPGREQDFAKAEDEAHTALANAVYVGRLNQELDLMRIESEVLVGLEEDVAASIEICESALDGLSESRSAKAAEVAALESKFRSLVEQLRAAGSMSDVANLAAELRTTALTLSDLVFMRDRNRLLRSKL